MRMITRTLAIATLIAAIASAQTQVGTANSPATFTLRGASVTPGTGVQDMPVFSGDMITAGDQPVTLTFPDGSTITMLPHAEATVTFSPSGQPEFKLLKGKAQYSLKSLNSVQVVTGDKIATLTTLTGTITKTAVLTTTTLGVGGAAAATALAVGVTKATSGGSSVSPSK